MALLPPKGQVTCEVLEGALIKLCMAVDAVWDEVRDPPEDEKRGDPDW